MEKVKDFFNDLMWIVLIIFMALSFSLLYPVAWWRYRRQ